MTQVVNAAPQQFQTTTYQYDDLGRKFKEIDADPSTGGDDSGSPTTTYAYALNGNVLSTTDPNGHMTWTVYDALNRPIKTVERRRQRP